MQALRAAVARAVKAGDTDAERAARAGLAFERLAREFRGFCAAGVRLDGAQTAQLHALVDGLTDGPVRLRF